MVGASVGSRGSLHTLRCASALLAILLAPGCAGLDAGPLPLTAEVPLHLEEHLGVATIVGSEIPEEVPAAVEWRFDQPQSDWMPTVSATEDLQPVEPLYIDDAVHLPLTGVNRNLESRRLVGGVHVELPDWNVQEWSHVEIRARASDAARNIGLGFNYTTEDPQADAFQFYSGGRWVPLVADDTVQVYRLPVEPQPGWQGPWTDLEVWFNTEQDAATASLEVLSVSVIPKEAGYAAAPTGVREEVRDRVYRRALYAHAPGRLEYRIRVPDGGRLDVGLGVLRDDAAVTFAITATPEGGELQTLLEDTHDDPQSWGQRSVDLSHLAGQTVTLGLGATTQRAGTVVVWGAPTVSGTRATDLPNIIFYVIDGAGADYMSLYGYNRRTTPNLERIAAEGAVFERAYSNSHWTRPSTASFMTSLQHSVLGGFTNGFNVVPDDAPTMAQHMHRAGYETAVFTANPNAGRMSGLERSVDRFQDDWEEFAYFGGSNYNESSRVMHDAFWKWRENYPGAPYWVHFQTTDIHEDFPAVAPFAGLFVGPEQTKIWRAWNERLSEEGGHAPYSEAYEKTGISRPAFYTFHQGLYDETMAHNDYQLGRLVDRLKAEGEWENTLLVVGSDHAIDAAMDDMGIAMLDEMPPRWSYPMFRPSVSKVPLLFVWPGRIPAGQRLDETVSMIDVLPTILDLVGLPMPEVVQGQSLAPLLLGEDGWEPRPVILEQFNADGAAQDEFSRIEVVDGRWGASLEFSPAADAPPSARRPVPLLLYDLWNDPMCLRSVHDEHPDLVEYYTAFLEAQWEAHQALARRFTPGDEMALTPEQLRSLRALGYIR